MADIYELNQEIIELEDTFKEEVKDVKEKFEMIEDEELLKQYVKDVEGTVLRRLSDRVAKNTEQRQKLSSPIFAELRALMDQECPVSGDQH